MAPFRWFIPDVYPLLAALGVAVGLGVYEASYTLAYNPDVMLNRKRRQEHELDKIVNEKKAKERHAALFRRASAGHRTSVFNNQVNLDHLDDNPVEARH